MDCIALLESEIRSHPYLKVEDHDVISSICARLRLVDDPSVVNDAIIQQVEAEAGAVYLIGRYTGLEMKLRSRLDEHKAGRFVELGSRDDEGLKWTNQGRESWLLGTDARYTTQLEVLQKVGHLVSILKGLRDVVFGRDRKLEQLAINFRREIEIDRRGG